MPKIQILSDVLASQVAAGEVVERPASVVKELVENSMDAGATHIEVEILKGGMSLVKVTDNGCGMQKEDALLCLERHATSKLHSVDQLAAISTMGFRGEAMPSMASVSKFRLSTREQDSLEGVEIFVDGGTVKEVKATGMAEGTVTEVRNLFFNIPARRKFMRAETTESAHIEHQIRLHALAAFDIRFTFRKDGRLVFDLPASKDRRVRIAGLAGAEAGKALCEIPRMEQSGMSVFGYILPGEFARKGRRQQYIFLNGRPIEDSAVSRAIRDGFGGSLNDGLNPAAWLWLEMNPRFVDVNVHPAKKEVRFHQPFEVRKLVSEAVETGFVQRTRPSHLRGVPKVVSQMSGTKTAVESPMYKVPPMQHVVRDEVDEQRPVIGKELDQELEQESGKNSSKVTSQFAHEEASFDRLGEKGEGADSARKHENALPPNGLSRTGESQQVFQTDDEAGRDEQPSLSIIGSLQDSYVLLEGEEGLVILDPKAAQERIIYEGFISAAELGEIESQGLLVPELIELDARDLDIVLRHVENFTDAGIELESFGGGTLQIRSMPALLGSRDPRAFVVEMIDELVETQGSTRGKTMAFEQFARYLAKNATRGLIYPLAQVSKLLDLLFACELPYCTPSGSPTLIHISMKQLEHKFS